MTDDRRRMTVVGRPSSVVGQWEMISEISTPSVVGQGSTDLDLTGVELRAIVEPALQNIADTYESELSRTLKVFTSLLEPAIIIFMAMVVGAIVFSILSAVFDITSGIGK